MNSSRARSHFWIIASGSVCFALCRSTTMKTYCSANEFLLNHNPQREGYDNHARCIIIAFLKTLSKYGGWGYTSLSGKGLTSEPDPVARSRRVMRPHPHQSFGEGSACPALLMGGGTPPSCYLSMAGTPLQGTQGGTPSRFPARVYVGDEIPVVAQKQDLEGAPLGFMSEGSPPPVFPTGGGYLPGAPGGWG